MNLEPAGPEEPSSARTPPRIPRSARTAPIAEAARAATPADGSGDPSPDPADGLLPRREGLPKAYRMRHGRHYVEQLMGDGPLRTVRELSVADFHPPPHGDGDISSLQRSIAEVGVLQPLLVTADEGRYRVIAGANRLRAAMAAGLQTVPCLVHDLQGTSVDTLLVAAARRADPPPAAPAIVQPSPATATAPSAGADARPASDPLDSLAAAIDDHLRLGVLADLTRVELQRAQTLTAARSVLDARTAVSPGLVVAGGLMAAALARVLPEARLRNATVEQHLPVPGFQVAADPRLLSLALDCMAHGMLALCRGGDARLRVSVEGTEMRPALILSVAQDCTALEEGTARRFFDRSASSHPGGAAGAIMAACVRHVARLHGGRADVQAASPKGCALTLVVPRFARM